MDEIQIVAAAWSSTPQRPFPPPTSTGSGSWPLSTTSAPRRSRSGTPRATSTSTSTFASTEGTSPGWSTPCRCGSPSPKGDVDVDVNVRVDRAHFPGLVDALSLRLAIAQPEHWTPTFALELLATPNYALPLGVQATVAGSSDDFLLELRDRMRDDLDLLQRYDEAKVAAAGRGVDAYWQAKDHLLRPLRPH